MARIVMIALVFALVSVAGPSYVAADPTETQKLLRYDR